MRTDYLHATASGVIDVNGNASVTLRPDVGQYWALKFVRVSTSRTTLFSKTPYCAVYTGATSQTIPSTFIDDTLAGDGDTSGIVSGTVIEYGDGITAQFQFGTPGDVVVFDVYGETADVPPALGLVVPDVIGPHFFGKPVKPQPWQAATNVVSFEFTNPGVFSTAPITTPVGGKQYLYIHSMEWAWDTVLANTDGIFVGIGSLARDMASSLDPRFMEFHAFFLNQFAVGIVWQQLGTAVAGGTTCRGSIAYSFANVTAT